MQSKLCAMCISTHQKNDVTWNLRAASDKLLSTTRISLPEQQSKHHRSFFTFVQPRIFAVHDTFTACYDSVSVSSSFTASSSSCITHAARIDKSDTRYGIFISQYVKK